MTTETSATHPPFKPPSTLFLSDDGDHLRELGNRLATLSKQDARMLFDYLRRAHGIHVTTRRWRQTR